MKEAAMPSPPDRPPIAPDPLDVLADALHAIGPASAAVLAAHLGIAYSTITPRLRRLAAEHRATRRTDPDTGQNLWHATAPPTHATAADTATGRVDNPESDQPHATNGSRRRAKGSIGADVLRLLQACPDDTFKISQLAGALHGTSAGAIANSLHKLVLDGAAVQTCEKPATFRAT
jgi:hypothetical protein